MAQSHPIASSISRGYIRGHKEADAPMPLTDIAIKSAKPQAKQYKLTDGDGMFLLVMPNGSKYWRLKYRF